MEETRRMNLCSWIQPIISNIYHSDIGVCVGKAAFKDFLSSCHPSKDNSEKNDVFTVCIPYAGSTLQWQVLLDGRNSNDLPDFLIPENDGFDPDYEDIPSLSEWDPSRPNSLLRILKDLLRLYKEHHLHLLAESDAHISKGIQEVEATNEYPCMDVLVTKEDDARYRSTRINISILIQIRVDFSEIPDICFKDAPPEESWFQHPYMHIRTVANTGKIATSIHLPSRIEYVLGGRSNLKLPHYSAQNSVLLDYIEVVKRNLRSVVAVLRDGHTKRREYIAAFLCQCASNVLEYDAEDFCKISLLMTHEDFYFLVHVTLGRFFPQEQPKLTLQSIYHVTRRGALYQVVHTGYPYSPRWPGNEMVKRARSYIFGQIDNFRTGCMKNGTI